MREKIDSRLKTRVGNIFMSHIKPYTFDIFPRFDSVVIGADSDFVSSPFLSAEVSPPPLNALGMSGIMATLR